HVSPSDARLLCNSSIALGRRPGNGRGRTVSTEALSIMNLSGALGVGGASAQGAACWRFAAAAGQGDLYYQHRL
ncbi:MAG TPA: hypothetical protein VIK32_12955, partial [Candidatus Limnocylindrales bacterium]